MQAVVASLRAHVIAASAVRKAVTSIEETRFILVDGVHPHERRPWNTALLDDQL